MGLSREGGHLHEIVVHKRKWDLHGFSLPFVVIWRRKAADRMQTIYTHVRMFTVHFTDNSGCKEMMEKEVL